MGQNLDEFEANSIPVIPFQLRQTLSVCLSTLQTHKDERTELAVRKSWRSPGCKVVLSPDMR